MQIAPDFSQILLLNQSLLGGGGGEATGSFDPSSSFGPASILSIGSSSPAIDETYSQLANILTARYSASIPQQTAPRLSDREIQSLEEAFVLIEEGDLDAAEESLERILSSNRSNGAAVHALGLIGLERNEFEKAERLFRRADFLAPGRGYGVDAENAQVLTEDDETVLQRASRLADDPDTRARGTELLLRLIDRSPANAEARFLLGQTFLREGDLLNASKHFFSAISTAETGQLAGFQERIRGFIELLPSVPSLQRVLGRAQLRSGQFRDALESLNLAEAASETPGLFDSDFALSYVGIGREFLERGDITRALLNFRRAAEFDSDNSQVREALAEGLLARGDGVRRLGSLNGAISLFDEAARALGSAGSESLRRRLSLSAYDAGLRKERESIAAGTDLDIEALAFQVAFDLDSDNATYKRKLAETRNTIGDQFLADEELEAAIGSFRRAHELFANDTTYRDNLINAQIQHGDELLAQKRFDEAVDAYRQAFEVDTSNTTSKSKLAEGYNARGLDLQVKSRFIKAVADFKEALALFPDNTEYQANYDSLKGYDI